METETDSQVSDGQSCTSPDPWLRDRHAQFMAECGKACSALRAVRELIFGNTHEKSTCGGENGRLEDATGRTLELLQEVTACANQMTAIIHELQGSSVPGANAEAEKLYAWLCVDFEHVLGNSEGKLEANRLEIIPEGAEGVEEMEQGGCEGGTERGGRPIVDLDGDKSEMVMEMGTHNDGDSNPPSCKKPKLSPTFDILRAEHN